MGGHADRAKQEYVWLDAEIKRESCFQASTSTWHVTACLWLLEITSPSRNCWNGLMSPQASGAQDPGALSHRSPSCASISAPAPIRWVLC